VLSNPLVLFKSAPAQWRYFRFAVLSTSVPAPTAVFKDAVVTLSSDSQPTAALNVPACKAEKRRLTFRSIGAGIPAIRRGLTAGAFGQDYETG